MLNSLLILAAACQVLSFQMEGIQRHIPIKRKEEILSAISLKNFRDSQEYGEQPYIVQLYKQLAKEPRRLPFGAQFVRSFAGKGRSKKKSAVLKFDIRIPKNERILYAMLHFCVSSEILNEISTLRFTDVRSGEVVSKSGEELKNRNCPLMEVTTMVRKKRNARETSLILRVIMLGKMKIENTMRTAGIRKLSSLVEIIVFSNERNPVSPIVRFSLLPKLEMLEKRDTNGQRNFVSKGGCYKKSLIVSFVGLGYSDIIAPTIFDIKQCSGTCQYPLGSKSNPTQHSLIQQLLHSLYGRRVAKSTCCAPKKYFPLTTMIKDSYTGGIAIRSLEEMIVAECGCQ